MTVRVWYDPAPHIIRVARNDFSTWGAVDTFLVSSSFLTRNNGEIAPAITLSGVGDFYILEFFDEWQDEDGNRLGQTVEEVVAALEAIVAGPVNAGFERYLGTIGAAPATYQTWPAAKSGDFVIALDNTTIEGVSLAQGFRYRCTTDNTDASTPDNWELLQEPPVSASIVSDNLQPDFITDNTVARPDELIQLTTHAGFLTGSLLSTVTNDNALATQQQKLRNVIWSDAGTGVTIATGESVSATWFVTPSENGTVKSIGLTVAPNLGSNQITGLVMRVSDATTGDILAYSPSQEMWDDTDSPGLTYNHGVRTDIYMPLDRTFEADTGAQLNIRIRWTNGSIFHADDSTLAPTYRTLARTQDGDPSLLATLDDVGTSYSSTELTTSTALNITTENADQFFNRGHHYYGVGTFTLTVRATDTWDTGAFITLINRCDRLSFFGIDSAAQPPLRLPDNNRFAAIYPDETVTFVNAGNNDIIRLSGDKNAFLGTLGSSGADNGGFPAARQGDYVAIHPNEGMVNSVDLTGLAGRIYVCTHYVTSGAVPAHWTLLPTSVTSQSVTDTLAAQPGEILTVNPAQSAATVSGMDVVQEDDVNVARIATTSSETWFAGQNETLTATDVTTRDFEYTAPSTSRLAGFGLKADTVIRGLKMRMRSSAANGLFSRATGFPVNFGLSQDQFRGIEFVGDRLLVSDIGRLAEIDESTGIATPVANVTDYGGTSLSFVQDLAWHEGTLYAVREATAPGVDHLFSIDPDTSIATQIQGSRVLFEDVFFEAIASFNGQLYMTGGNRLYIIDPIGLTRTEVGVFTPSVVPFTLTGTPDGLLANAGNNLYRVNPDTAAVTLISVTGVTSSIWGITYKDSAVYLLARDSDTQLYVGYPDGVGHFPSQAVFDDDTAAGRTAVPVDGTITVPADRDTRLVRGLSYTVTTEWTEGTLRHQDQRLALDIQSFTDGPHKLVTAPEIEVLEDIEPFALTTNTTVIPPEKLPDLELFAFEANEDALIPVNKLPAIPADNLPDYVAGALVTINLADSGTDDPVIMLPAGYLVHRLVFTGVRRVSGSGVAIGFQLGNASDFITANSYQLVFPNGGQGSTDGFRLATDIDGDANTDITILMTIVGARDASTSVLAEMHTGGRIADVPVVRHTTGALGVTGDFDRLRVTSSGGLLGRVRVYGERS